MLRQGKASQTQHSALTSSTILVTLAPDEATDVPTVLCNFTWSLACFRLLRRRARESLLPCWPRLLQAFLADEVRHDDDDDDSGSTVDPALYKQFKMCLHGIGGAGNICHPRSDHSHSLGYAQFGAHHLSVRHCISECEWHHYSISSATRTGNSWSGTITLHSITPYNFKLFNINKTYKHVRTFTPGKTSNHWRILYDWTTSVVKDIQCIMTALGIQVPFGNRNNIQATCINCRLAYKMM
jgi:hypothetical protein